MEYNEEAKQIMVRLHESRKITPALGEQIAQEIIRLGPEAFKLLVTWADPLVYAGLRRWVRSVALRMKREEVVPILLEAMSHPDFPVHETGMYTLWEMGTDVRDALVENLSKCEVPGGRIRTLWCLHRLADPYSSAGIGDKSVLPAMQAAAKSDPSEHVRGSAVEMLSRCEAASAEENVLAGLEDTSEHVRFHAAKSAGRMRLAKAVGAMVQMLDDKDPDVRADVVYALDQIGDAGAAKAVRKLLSDADWCVRWAAAKALENLWEDQNIEPLIQATADENSLVAVAALETLSLKAPDRAKDILKKAADSPDPSVRGTAKYYARQLSA